MFYILGIIVRTKEKQHPPYIGVNNQIDVFLALFVQRELYDS
jgi:hypothetical protein